MFTPESKRALREYIIRLMVTPEYKRTLHFRLARVIPVGFSVDMTCP